MPAPDNFLTRTHNYFTPTNRKILKEIKSMAYDINQILAEIQNAKTTGDNDDQVNALIQAQILPIIQKQADDEKLLADIKASVDTLGQDGVSEQTVLQAIADKLAGVSASSVPAAPATPPADAPAAPADGAAQAAS